MSACAARRAPNYFWQAGSLLQCRNNFNER
jgi:hypothetical protein